MNWPGQETASTLASLVFNGDEDDDTYDGPRCAGCNRPISLDVVLGPWEAHRPEATARRGNDGKIYCLDCWGITV
jgi:hypothetical protein